MDPIKKKILLKMTDHAMFKLGQPSTQTGIVATLGCITWFTVHNTYVQIGAVVVNLITGLYNWFRNEITQAELDAKAIMKDVKNDNPGA